MITREYITLEEWNLFKPATKELIFLFQKSKHQPEHWNLSLGEMLMILKQYGWIYHKDQPIEQYSYEHMLMGQNTVVAWDGEELANALVWEIKEELENVKR